MNKDKNYWLERGKDGPMKEGFVCVGTGVTNGLGGEIGVFETDLYSTCGQGGGDLVSCWRGNGADFYYLKAEKFNSLFPEPEKTKKEKIAELEAEIERLKKETESEKFKIGDLVLCIFCEYHYIVRISEVDNVSIWGDYYFLHLIERHNKGRFPFDRYKMTKIEL